MKMDLRQVLPLTLFFTVTLAACGKQKVASDTYQKPADECVPSVVPKHYVIRYADRSIKTVQAESLGEFFSEHVEPELDKIAYTEPEYFVQASVARAQASAPTADNWGVVRVGADALWAASVRGAGISVAVIDSGMDSTHAQLSGQVLANPGEQGTDSQGRNKESNGADDDGNGYTDDAYGWDFIKNQPLQGDYQLHGTHVSGIIAASHSDTVAGAANHVQGIAPAAKILPLAFLNQEGSGMMSDGVRAIYYAVSRGVRVINASWGGPVCSQSLKDAVASLSDSGTIFVAAAGNGYSGKGYNVDRYTDYPASLNAPIQFTVGASSPHDLEAQFSNFGPINVHIFAPGMGIISTVPGGMMALEGTSMAAPIVSGAIALLLSAEPTATAAQLRTAIYNTAFKNPGLKCAAQGRLDLRNALAELRKQMGP
jgi:subtilisin family serine protease